MSYLVRIGTQTIGPMSREAVLRQAPKWQTGSLAVSIAQAGTQNFLPLTQFMAGAQAINPPPTTSASAPPPPAFGQSSQQPQPAQPLPFSTQTSHQPWSQPPRPSQAPFPWQQPVPSSAGSASKSSAPFVALVIGGVVVVIVALLLIVNHQRNQRKIEEQKIAAQQQDEERQRQLLAEQRRKDEERQAELLRQELAAQKAEATTALDDVDAALQAAENEARNAPEGFSDDFQQLRGALAEARQLVSQGDYQSGQENAGQIKTQIEQVRAKVTKAIDDARAEEEISRAIDALSDEMGVKAQAAAKNKHPVTKEENTIRGEERITYRSNTRIDFTVSFDCRRVGSILGWDRFSVGVEVSGRLEKSGQNWKGYVLGSHVTFDVEK